MKLKDLPQDIVDVDDYGFIGAGVVVPFAPTGTKRTVAIPRGLAKPSEVGTMTVSGDSMTGVGLYDGDVIVFRMNHTKQQILHDSVCVVEINATGELIAKHVLWEGSHIILRSSNPLYPDRRYEVDDVDVLGLMFAVQKLADPFGRLLKTPEPERKVDQKKLKELIKQFEKPKKDEEQPF